MTKLDPMNPAAPVTRTFMRGGYRSERGGPVSMVCPHEGDHPGRWIRHATAPDHARDQQAAHAGLRQADDLLPAVYPDDGRHPGSAGHHDPGGRPAVRATPG